jgi:catechol 2,3-dioxygenase-like lactoylglutathione lyase family enzyme
LQVSHEGTKARADGFFFVFSCLRGPVKDLHLGSEAVKSVLVFCLLPFALLLSRRALSAQLASPNASGVAMGHLHYHVRDVEANRKFWIALGGQAARLGATEVVKFPGVLVVLTQGPASGGTNGSVVNHVAFRVQSFAKVEEAGFTVQRLAQFPGVGSVNTPEGERIELFENAATNLTFTPDAGPIDAVADRHNHPLPIPVAFHHVHLYVPQGADAEAKAWYVRMFGGVPGRRSNYQAADFPGINMNFSGQGTAQAATRGRMLDHIGFEITNLEAFCRQLEGRGVRFDAPYVKGADGVASAWLTDPWGTSIELTEGLARL